MGREMTGKKTVTTEQTIWTTVCDLCGVSEAELGWLELKWPRLDDYCYWGSDISQGEGPWDFCSIQCLQTFWSTGATAIIEAESARAAGRKGIQEQEAD